jgi:DNA repair protein RadC
MNLFTHSIAEITVTYNNRIKNADRPKVSSSGDAFNIMQSYVLDAGHQISHREYFYVMLLNRSNRVLGISTISMGGMSGTVADPKIIFQLALKAVASSVILVHNHPSGNTQPSETDLRLTRKLKNAGQFLDLPVLDHLILTPEDGYLSMADQGLL